MQSGQRWGYRCLKPRASSLKSPKLRACSWEGRRSPKPLHGVQILTLVLDLSFRLMTRRRGSTEKGAGPVNRFMLVRIQSSALNET